MPERILRRLRVLVLLFSLATCQSKVGSKLLFSRRSRIQVIPVVSVCRILTQKRLSDKSLLRVDVGEDEQNEDEQRALHDKLHERISPHHLEESAFLFQGNVFGDSVEHGIRKAAK